MPGISKPNPLVEKAGWRKGEWGNAVGLRPSRVAELIADKSIDSVKVGGARVILTPPLAFLESHRETVV